MNSASKDICSILTNNSLLGLTFATNLFIGREPATPDNCVIVFDIPGEGPLLTLDKAEGYYYSACQIRVRNNDYQTGWALIQAIQVLLHGIYGEVWNGATYLLIKAIRSEENTSELQSH